METIFDRKTYESLAARIEKLSPSTKQVWGKMNVAQMLAHCAYPMKVAANEIVMKRSMMGRIIGPMIKKTYLSDTPFKKGNPTAKEFTITDHRDFEKEKQDLLGALKRFHEGGEAKATTNPHGFFGQLTKKQWGEVQWKHLDHHLRQFGV